MKNINKLRQELMVMDTLEIKPNYIKLAREHECDPSKISKLDKYKDEIKEKLELPGSTINGTFQFFKRKDEDIGNYKNSIKKSNYLYCKK